MKLHVIGLAGSGKTTFAEWASSALSVPPIDLDFVVYSERGERSQEALLAQLAEIRARDNWITEGAYHEPWVSQLLDDADIVVWLDVPLVISLARIAKRHVHGELARNNKHPGWVKLVRFLNYTRRTAPKQRMATIRLLHRYAPKVRCCRSNADLHSTKATLIQQHTTA